MLLFTVSIIASLLSQFTIASPLPKSPSYSVGLVSYGIGSYDTYSECYFNIDDELKQFHMSPFQQLQSSSIVEVDMVDFKDIKEYLELSTGRQLLMFNEIVTGTCTVPPNTSMMQSFTGEAVTAVISMRVIKDPKSEPVYKTTTLLFPSSHHSFACLEGEGYCDTKTVSLKTNFI